MKKYLLFLTIIAVWTFEACENKQSPEEGNMLTDTTVVIPRDTLTKTQQDTVVKKGPVFRCTGNEPFWALTVADTGISFYEDALEKTWNFSAENSSITDKKYIYKVSNNANDITIEITKEPCEDDMSGEPFDYSVIINKDGNNFTGCCKCLEEPEK